ncbi:MAG: GFA family protein [Kofleriaceae bacterium]|nr:GFA family protein [Myxococcales bacterium]MCB9561545.1 GFA family protein [Kofleriaceae bacterium]MCB9572262.1 GFA family protein [Kofleriaceae bacterium]
MTTTCHGSCVCGAVAFRVDGPFTRFPYCHCSRCRKRTGSAHAANLFVPAAQFAWERGEELVRVFRLPTAPRWSNAFCTVCGSPMPWLARTGASVLIPAGALDDDPGLRPELNIHFASRAPWYAHAAELETFDELPPG